MKKRSLYLLTTVVLSTLTVTTVPASARLKLFDLESTTKGQAQKHEHSTSDPLQPSHKATPIIAQADTTSDDVWKLLNQAQEAERDDNLEQAAVLYREVLSKPLPNHHRVRVNIDLEKR